MKRFLFPLFFFGFLFVILPFTAKAAGLTLSPTSGTFTVGSTFDISVFLDTQGQSVNALQVSLSFPPDKLQLVSPATSKSIIGIWTSQPQFNNQTGEIDLEGGLPGGINVSSGLITTLTFRVKAVGEGIIKFLDNSKVLLNDGLGTDALRQTQGGLYDLVLPPPAGPFVISKTDPDQSKWYSSSLVTFDWTPTYSDVQGYSYVLNDQPVVMPDNISEGLQTGVAYTNVPNGTHYFHIKSLRAGVWGGVTNFAVNIDTAGPAEFPITIIPDSRTTRTQPIIQFFATDPYSGIDYYEIKIVPLTPNPQRGVANQLPNQNLFVEATSPYVTPVLRIGDYDVIVRAHDKAGNYREEIQRLEIRQALFESLSGQGLRVAGVFTIPWPLVFIVGLILLVVLIWLARFLQHWHKAHDLRIAQQKLPQHVQAQLKELKRLQAKYSKSLFILLIIGFSLFFGVRHSVQAQILPLAPPLINEISRNISNQDIFYVGGKTDIGGANVIIYLQNLQTGETLSETVTVDKLGNWFYRHSTFLTTGNYLLWTQAQAGDQMSPPSPQEQLSVSPTAIQFGASRFSYETIYLILMIVFLMGLLGLGAYVVYHGRRAIYRSLDFQKQTKEAEESVRRGFAVLRRDILKELELIKKAKAMRTLSAEEKVQEELILNDLEAVEQYVGKEIWDIEHQETV